MAQNKEFTQENIDEEFKKLRQQLVWDLIRDEIAMRLKVEVTEDDLMNEARSAVYRQLSQYGPQSLTEGILEHYAKEVLKDNKNRDAFERNALNRKVFDAIKENVTLDNKEVSVEEFRKLYYGA